MRKSENWEQEHDYPNVTGALQNREINKKFLIYLYVERPQIGIFYLLPEI